jgi:hypothetical protein
MLLYCSGGWQQTCVLLGHLAISWVTRDIIPGARRALLSVHVSDTFDWFD